MCLLSSLFKSIHRSQGRCFHQGPPRRASPLGAGGAGCPPARPACLRAQPWRQAGRDRRKSLQLSIFPAEQEQDAAMHPGDRQCCSPQPQFGPAPLGVQATGVPSRETRLVLPSAFPCPVPSPAFLPSSQKCLIFGDISSQKCLITAAQITVIKKTKQSLISIFFFSQQKSTFARLNK